MGLPATETVGRGARARLPLPKDSRSQSKPRNISASWGIWSYQGNHANNGSVSGHQEKKCNLDDVKFLKESWLQLLLDQGAYDIFAGVCSSLVDQLLQVFKKVPTEMYQFSMPLI